LSFSAIDVTYKLSPLAIALNVSLTKSTTLLDFVTPKRTNFDVLASRGFPPVFKVAPKAAKRRWGRATSKPAREIRVTKLTFVGPQRIKLKSHLLPYPRYIVPPFDVPLLTLDDISATISSQPNGTSPAQLYSVLRRAMGHTTGHLLNQGVSKTVRGLLREVRESVESVEGGDVPFFFFPLQHVTSKLIDKLAEAKRKLTKRAAEEGARLGGGLVEKQLEGKERLLGELSELAEEISRHDIDEFPPRKIKRLQKRFESIQREWRRVGAGDEQVDRDLSAVAEKLENC
jgi:hypothetical protein